MEKRYFVIDMHSHIVTPNTHTRIQEMSSSNGRALETFEAILKWQRDVGYDKGIVELNPSPQKFAKKMEESGTDLSILSMLSFAEEAAGKEISSSEYIAEILPDYKNIFLAFASVDPRAPNADEKVEYFIKEKGFSGVTINPNDWSTLPLDSPMLGNIFETCQKLHAPVHIHTGVDPTGYIEYGNPILLDKIALHHPNVKIVLEHYGFPYKYEAYAMCNKHKNVYLCLAAHFNKLVHHNRILAWLELEEMRIHAGIHKILYGSDYPVTPNNKEVIEFLMNDNMPLLLRFSGVKNWTFEMRANVLGLNAAKLLGISNSRITEIRNQLTKPIEEQKSEAPQEPEIAMSWTQEAIEILNAIPVLARKDAVSKIEQYARESKIDIITKEVMRAASKSYKG